MMTLPWTCFDGLVFGGIFLLFLNENFLNFAVYDFWGYDFIIFVKYLLNYRYYCI